MDSDWFNQSAGHKIPFIFDRILKLSLRDFFSILSFVVEISHFFKKGMQQFDKLEYYSGRI